MSEDYRRQANGQFVKGLSGNPDGRPPKIRPDHRYPPENRDVAIEVAEMPVTMTINGEATEVSLYRANLLMLGKKGLEGHTASGKEFLRRIDSAAAVNGDVTQIVDLLVAQLHDALAEVREWRKRYPKQTHGVLVLDADDWQATRPKAIASSAE